MRTQIEVHYYDGGLRVKTHPGAQRSHTLPPSESVYLNPEVPLDENDLLFEYSTFRDAAGKPVEWLACYAKSVDKQFGDRGSNYVAFGVWLFDGVLSKLKDVMSNLREGVLLLREDVRAANESKFAAFHTYLEGQFQGREAFPISCRGVVEASADRESKRVFTVRGNLPDVFAQLECALISLTLSPAPFSSAARHYFKVSSEVDGAKVGNPLPSQRELLMPFANSLAQIFGDCAASQQALEIERDALSENVKAMESALAGATEDLRSLQSSNASLVQKNDDFRREVDRLKEMGLPKISTQLDEIKNLIRATQRSAATGFEPWSRKTVSAGSQNSVQTKVLPPKRRDHSMLQIWIAVGAVVLVGFVSVAIYLIFH